MLLRGLLRPGLVHPGRRWLTVKAAKMGTYTYDWPKPSVTVDTVIVARPSDKHPTQLLLIKRKNEPFKDKWALPGGFVDQGETLDAAAARELQEETSVDPASVLLTQVGAFGDPGRDPRGWTITVAYVALVPSPELLNVQAADDAADAKWWSVLELPPLAFDHKLVVRKSLLRLVAEQKAAGAGTDDEALFDELARATAALDGPWK